MYSAQNLRASLEAFKRDVIGLVKNQDRFDLIVYKWEDLEAIDTITISQFGAIHENFRFPISYGQVKYFPKGRTMDQMLDSPFEFDAFIKSFN